MLVVDWSDERIKSLNKGKMFGLKCIYKIIFVINKKIVGSKR